MAKTRLTRDDTQPSGSQQTFESDTLPDPTEAPDGQGPVTNAGLYVLTGIPRVHVSDTDPGVTGDTESQHVWIRTYTDAGLDPEFGTPTSFPAYVRNAADTDWLPLGSAAFDGDGNLRAVVDFNATAGGLNLYTFQADGTMRCSITIDEAGIDTWWRDDDGNIRTMMNVNGGADPKVELQVNDTDGSTSLATIGVSESELALYFGENGVHSVLLTTAGVTIDTSANVKMPNLPTSDPTVAGALWVDSLVVKRSAG